MTVLRWWIFIILGFFFCGILTLIPLPMNYQWLRPEWLLLFVIFCQLTEPKLFNPIVAWVIGLFLDNLLGTPLGENALIFAVMSFVTACLRARFIQKPLWLSFGKIFFLILLAKIFMLWFHALSKQSPHSLWYWSGLLTNTMIWPLFVILLQKLCQVFSVEYHVRRNPY